MTDQPTSTPPWLSSPSEYRDHYERRLATVGHKLEKFNLNRMRWFAPLPGWTILDLGCGTGASVVEYAQRGHQVVGVDIAQSALDRLQERIDGQEYECSVQLVRAAIEDYSPPFPFDAVLLCDVLEHVIDMAPVLQAAHRCLRPGGQLYITAPAFRVGQAEHVRGVSPAALLSVLNNLKFTRIQVGTPWNRPERPHYPLTVCIAWKDNQEENDERKTTITRESTESDQQLAGM